MDINNYLAYLLIAFLTITSPGAAILLAINNSMKYGLKATFFSSIGNILGLFILSFIAILGVGTLIKTSDIVFNFLKITGGLYLIYLGINHMRAHKHFNITKKEEENSFKLKKIFTKGFLVAITNPKPILFFSAIFPLFMTKDYPITTQFFIMTFTFMFISLCSLMSYAFLAKKAKMWFLNDESVKIFYRISGIIFMLMGIGMFFINR